MRWIGSTMMAAISCPCVSRMELSASRSLNGATSISSCTTAGMPAVSGCAIGKLEERFGAVLSCA